MQTLSQDLRYGLRMLLKKPGFTAVAVVTLALGIGANTAIFSVVNGVLLRSLPYKEPERLVMLWEATARSRSIHLSHPNFVDWRAMNQSFESVSAFTGRWGGKSTVTGGSEPDRAYAVGVYRDFFKVFGVAPAVGRVFLPEESQYGTTPVVVVSYGFWQRRLGSDPSLGDKKLTIDGDVFHVVGVMPPGFSFPAETDLWVSHEQLTNDNGDRTSHNFAGIALSPETIPRLDEIRLDARTLAFTLGISLLTSLLFGLLPAIRVSKTDLQESLKEGGRAASSGSGALRGLLVVAEVALTLILLVGAGLLGRSFWRLLQVNPGFNPENVMTMQLSLPESDYGEAQQRRAFYDQLLQRVQSLPGVEAAGVINNLPMGGVNINGQFQIEGQREWNGYAGFRVVSADYFRALNIRLVSGRNGHRPADVRWRVGALGVGGVAGLLRPGAAGDESGSDDRAQARITGESFTSSR